MNETRDEVLRQGNSCGQIAISKFILHKYDKDISSDLRRFLEKVLQDNYDAMAVAFDKPSEDIAMRTEEIMLEASK